MSNTTSVFRSLAFASALAMSSAAYADIITVTGPASTQDATVTLETPDTALGGNAQDGNLQIRNEPTSTGATLLRFDLPTLGAGEYVESVTMDLNYFANTSASGTPTIEVTVHRLLDSWVETEATWNSRSTGNAWAGGNIFAESSGEPINYDSATLASASMTRDDFGIVSFSGAQLTSTIEDMMEGTLTNNGFILKASGGTVGNTRFLFMSSDRTGSGVILPELTITTDVPEPGSMALIAAGLTLLIRRKSRIG